MILLYLLTWIGGWATEGVNIQKACRLPIFFANNGDMMPVHDVINPPALYHNGKTYVVWQTLDPYIAYYDTVNGWSNKVRIGSNPLSDDSHGAPAIVRDTFGYFHVFYGCHNGYIQYAKSSNADDITLWTDKGNIGDNTSTYPQPELIDGNIYIFFRGNGNHVSGDECYIKSTDGGNSWGSVIQLIECGADTSTGYGNIEVEDDSLVHYAFVIDDNTGASLRLDLYHFYLNLNNDSLWTIDGNYGTDQVTTADIDSFKIIDTGIDETNAPRIHINSGNPYIIYPHDDGGWKHKFVYWNGSSWTSPDTIVNTDHQFNFSDFIIHASDSIEAYLITSGESGRNGDIERWDWNGSSWNQTKVILREGTTTCNIFKGLANPWIVRDYSNEIKIIFSEGYDDGTKVFAWSDNGFISK